MLNFLKNNKLIIIATCAAIAFIVVICSLYSVDSTQNDNILSYINSLGWEVDKKPIEISYLIVPNQFDIIYETYNELQKESGFDLSKHKGEKVIRYSYKLLNHTKSRSELVRVNVITSGDKIIAGDICSNSLSGFMHPITDMTNKQY